MYPEPGLTSDPVSGLEIGMDFRLPEYRREVFLRFYDFHLKHKTHPGCVYFVIPWLAEHFGWGQEETLWFALLNGHTQNPLTSLILHQQGPSPDDHLAVASFYKKNYPRMRVDTDRRHQKPCLAQLMEEYAQRVGGSQEDYWASMDGWDEVWDAGFSLPHFGRLSAWSFLEYVNIAMPRLNLDPTTMMFGASGSASHRNGMAKVLGRDDLYHGKPNPQFDGKYGAPVLDWFEVEADLMLSEAAERAGADYVGDVRRLTLESALCTYKSWHKPRRRYPNVYADMLHDRIKGTEREWPELDFSVWWDMREDCLPPELRQESNPRDPGLCELKQNWYLHTGEVVMMDEYPAFANGFYGAASPFM